MSLVNVRLEPKRDNTESIESIIRNNTVYLRRFIARRVKNKCDIDDYMQATLLEVIRSYNSFRGESQVKTWLCGIAYNVIRNDLKRKEKKPTVLLEEMSADIDSLSCASASCLPKVSDPADIVEYDEQISHLHTKLESLPQKMRGVVNSLIIEGNSYQDTAVTFNVPLGTVQSRMANARKILRTELKR
ncbi:RNA polymerase sigma factor [Agarilytica rhodophyticola]|uniref:RNA polymerase sigma factor n=1 Tax=Agarilytica rhodophyticola TaxID=1737490 RepID=UPI000B343769|nr:sigma-70 family RNA polymerase sigma factor [Agarilytica rhodophyticola]